MAGASTFGELFETLRGEVREVSAAELSARLAAPNPPRLVDIREADELAAGRLPGAAWVPRSHREIGDNFATRYLLNDACVKLGKPNVHGALYRFEGQVTTFVPGRGPCYRCLYPKAPPPELSPACAEAGVLGVLPGVVGLLQATEALKLLLGTGQPLIGRLLTYDALESRFTELVLKKDSACPTCGMGADVVLTDGAPGCATAAQR